MNSESAASPISSESTATGSPIVLPLTEIGKSSGQWTLTLLPSHLALADEPNAQPYVILREQIMKTVVLMEGTRALMVEQPRKVMFKLTPAGVAALADWIGKPFLASFYLKRRYSWVSLWAFLWVGGSLMTLIPTQGSGIAAQFDVISFLMGAALLTASAFARWRPHPILFLVDSIWFFSIAIHLTVDIVQGRGKGWLVLVALMVWAGVTGFKHFLRFRRTRLAPLPK